ncbi:hypothetical protein FI667_g10657, partial [Globisporangium splendens]
MMELTYDQIATSGGEPVDGYRIEFPRCVLAPSGYLRECFGPRDDEFSAPDCAERAQWVWKRRFESSLLTRRIRSRTQQRGTSLFGFQYQVHASSHHDGLLRRSDKQLTISPLTGNLVNIVVADTVLSIGLAMECRATIDTVVSSAKLKLTHTCAVATLSTPGLVINVHWGPAVLPLCGVKDPWNVMDTPTLTSFVSRLGAFTDPLPLFQLGTSAGVAFNLATGGLKSDVATSLRIRSYGDVEHPTGSFLDYTTPISVSLDALAYATREIQSIRIATTAGDLTHGVGGFRIKFGDEISSNTLRGGDGGNLNDDIGCLLWSSGTLSADTMRDVLALEVELESFTGIDDVRVYRTFTPSPTTMVYTIEFLGVSVRGKLPSLQIRDVGINGCSGFDGTPAGTVPIAPVVVLKEQLAYVTIYQAPTTRPIPFDATDEDVKGALEALSSLPNVDVTRKVAKFGYDWKITYIAFDDPRAPPTFVANGFALQAVQDPKVTVTQFNWRKLDTRAISAGGGVSIFVRVAAHNKNGFGDSSVPVPASIQLANQLPSEVLFPYVEVLSSSELLVQWDYPWNDGGEEVTEYKVEWWSSTVNGGVKQSYVLHHLESPRQIADVNTISISAPSAGSNTYLSGTFQVGFDGEWSNELRYDLSAVMMQSVLKNLSTIEDVSVDRVLNTNGYTDQPTACTTSLRDTCVPKLANSIMPSISIGTRQEIQALTCTGTPSAATGFKLNYMGAQTALIPSSAAAADVEAALKDILVAGAVSVSFSDPAQMTVCVAANAARLLIEFNTELGDVNLLTASSVSAGLTIPPIEELRKGRTQVTPGRMLYSYVVSGLTTSNVYNVRIAAYNSIGFGPFTTAQPLGGVVPVAKVPTALQSLTVQARLSSSTLLMVWEEPLSNGGSSVDSYRVEWDVNPAYTSQCGERSEVQTLVSTHTSTPSAGDKYKLLIGTDVVGCVDWQETAANLQLMVRALGGVYANAEVTRFGDGTARWDFGYTYTVTFVNPVTAVPNVFPLNIPLFSIDKTDTNCNSYQGKVLPKRATFGPGLDDKFGQGKIDSTNNECSSLLNEPIAKQTITEAVAMASGLSLPAIQLALATTTTSTPVGGTAAGQTTLLGAHAPVLCDSCVQKLAANTLTITSAALIGVINNGDYFIVEEVLADTVASSSTSLRKCVMKAAAAATTTSIVIDATDVTFLNGGYQLPTTFESNAWTLKRFNMCAHVVQDLIAGRDYSVRVVAKNAQGESQAAMA